MCAGTNGRRNRNEEKENVFCGVADYGIGGMWFKGDSKGDGPSGDNCSVSFCTGQAGRGEASSGGSR